MGDAVITVVGIFGAEVAHSSFGLQEHKVVDVFDTEEGPRGVGDLPQNDRPNFDGVTHRISDLEGRVLRLRTRKEILEEFGFFWTVGLPFSSLLMELAVAPLRTARGLPQYQPSCFTVPM